jgi:hypothetical protein
MDFGFSATFVTFGVKVAGVTKVGLAALIVAKQPRPSAGSVEEPAIAEPAASGEEFVEFFGMLYTHDVSPSGRRLGWEQKADAALARGGVLFSGCG